MATIASIVTAAVLAGAFLWGAAAKVAHFADWRLALNGYSIPSMARPLIILVVPLAETAVAVLLLIGPLKSGAALAAALLAAFSWAIVRARSLQGDRLPCGCFGRTTARDYRLMLLRNGLLGLLVAVVLLSGTQEGILRKLGGLSMQDVLPVTLIGLASMLSLWTVRQVANALRGRQS